MSVWTRKIDGMSRMRGRFGRTILGVVLMLVTSAQAHADFYEELLKVQAPQKGAKSDAAISSFRWQSLFLNGERTSPIRTENDIPSPLMEAVRQTGCDLRNLAHTPGQIVRIRSGSSLGRVFAVLPCQGAYTHSDSLYEVGRDEKIRRVELTTITRSGSFGTTAFPGTLEWDAEQGTLTATPNTDMIGPTELRYSYKLAGDSIIVRLSSPIVLDHVDLVRRGSQETQRIWQATPLGGELPN